MTSVFEYHGYYEQLFDPEKRQVVGNRNLGDIVPDRKIGVDGDKEITITEDFEVQRGHKTVTIKVRKPLKLISTLYPICGRIKGK